MKALSSPCPTFIPRSNYLHLTLRSNVQRFSSFLTSASLITPPPKDFNFKNEILDISTAAVAETHPELLDLAKDGTLILINKTQYGPVPPWRSEFVEPEAIWIIGTNHISPESASDVEKVIRVVKPDNVVVELCRSRAGIMYISDDSDQNWQRRSSVFSLSGTGFFGAVGRSINLGGQTALALRLLLATFSSKVSSDIDRPFGDEFRAARKASEQIGAQLVLGDRPIEITLERAWNSLKWKEKLSLVSSVLRGITSSDLSMKNVEVPIGWDKLSLSLISSETGKIVRKSGKGSVKNGTCRWTESFTESVWMSDVDDSKEQEQYIVKFLIAMGSSKSGILGEINVNLAAFLSSEAPTLVSLPLKKCNYGTILQVEIKCLTPKTNVRDEKRKELNARKHENKNDDQDIGSSDFTIAKRSSDKFSTASFRPKELGSRETSFSASASSYSFDSMDEAMGRQSLSSQNNLKTTTYAFGRQESIESQDSGSYSTLDSPNSDNSFHNPLTKDNHSKYGTEDHLIRKSSLQQNAACSKASDEIFNLNTVNELRGEAKMWEENAKNLILEVETLRKELNDQCQLNTESNSDCRKLREEIENLKMELDQENERTRNRVQKEELEDEIRFQKQSNENLSLQLKKTQESNIELISILQEMEETIEKQKMEIESLSVDTIRSNTCIREPSVVNDVIEDLQCSDSDSSVSGISVNEQLPQEKLQEIAGGISDDLLYMESLLEDKIIAADIERDVMNQILKNYILSLKDQETMNLEYALSRALCAANSDENKNDIDASKEIERLEGKVVELETDCNELTEENLQLLLQLKEVKTGSLDTPSEKCGSKIREEEEIIDRESIDPSPDRVHELILMEEEEGKQIPLMKHLSNLEEENMYLSERISGLEAQLRYLTEANESSRLELQHSESQAMNLRNKVQKLEEEIESQKADSKQKLLEMENRWKGAQEECRSLSKVNIRLQTTAESLIQDHNSLQKYNEELKEQKLKFQEQCMIMEGNVRTSRNSLCSCSQITVLKDSLSDEEITGEVKNEEVLKDIIDELDLSIKVSEIERIRLAEENSILYMQLEKVPLLQNEVIGLKISVKEMKLENQILEASLKSVSNDYEELERESFSMLERISVLEKTASETEDCRRKNVALEEKILRIGGDLIARDALHVQDTEMRNELAQIKTVNNQFQTKVKILEDIREELQCRVQYLEDELKKTRQEKEDQKETNSNCEGLQLSKEEEICMNETQPGRIEIDASGKIQSKETIGASKNEQLKMSVMEAELQEMRERYLQMSLKYAEVEAQRQQLVLKLRTFNNWNSFSQR